MQNKHINNLIEIFDKRLETATFDEVIRAEEEFIFNLTEYLIDKEILDESLIDDFTDFLYDSFEEISVESKEIFSLVYPKIEKYLNK